MINDNDFIITLKITSPMSEFALQNYLATFLMEAPANEVRYFDILNMEKVS
jgi:hypothetical protein